MQNTRGEVPGLLLKTKLEAKGLWDGKGGTLDKYRPLAQRHWDKHGNLEGWDTASKTAMGEYLQAERAARHKLVQDLKAQGHVFHRMTDEQVRQVVDAELDRIQSTGRTNVRAALREVGAQHGKGEDWVVAVSRQHRGSQMKQIIRTKMEHPVMQALQSTQNTSAIVRQAGTGTLAKGIGWVRHEYSNTQRIQRLEEQVAAIQRRHDVQDAGGSIKEEVLRVRRETGKGARTISKLLGVNENNVKRWFREAGL